MQTIFGWVCGQDPGHTWAPGGWPLPCCQRCTGLYVGACMAAVIHVWQCPRLTGRFLEAHGLMLLMMVPFGFHWVAQGPGLRSLSGVLFGAAVFTFLWLPLGSARVRPKMPEPRQQKGAVGPTHHAAYVLTLAVIAGSLPLAAHYGGRWAGPLLGTLAGCGFLALISAAAANLLVFGSQLVRGFSRLRARPGSA